MDCLWMFVNVGECLLMFVDFLNVGECLLMFVDVCECLWMFVNVCRMNLFWICCGMIILGIACGVSWCGRHSSKEWRYKA